MHLEIPIDKKDIKKLSEMLPDGSINELTKRTPFTQGYISRFFAGDYNVTDKNKIIVDNAIEIIAEQVKKAADMAKQINEHTATNKQSE